MNYNININQKAIVELNSELEDKLDLKDATILEWMLKFHAEPKSKKMLIGESVYFWGAYQLIIDENPLLEIDNKEVISRRVGRLVDAGLIQNFISKDEGNKTYFSITQKCFDLIKRDEKTLSTQKSIPIDSKVDTLSTQKSNNNNIIYNNIINNDFGKYLNDILFIENICMSQKLTKEELQLKIDEFVQKCEAFSDKFNNTKHIRSAFVSWLNKNKNNDHVEKSAEFFIKVFNKISNKEYFVTETLKDLLRIQLNNGITKEKLIDAVRNLYDSDDSNWHKKQNYIHATPEFLLKEENFNKYSNMKFKKR